MSSNNNNAKKPQPTTATSDFICTLKFSNNLPDLPFEPKLLTVPLDPLRLYKFQPENSLERDYKHSIIPEADLGIPLNLVDPHTFQCSPQLKAKGLQKRDQQLLTEEFKENKIDHSSIPWLRKTEYMTNDFSQETLYGRTGAKAKPAVDIQFKYTTKSIEEQVKTIEDSFEASKHIPVHPTKPSLTPVNITPFFPDHDHWRSRYSQVIFDQDPGDVIDKNSEHYEVKKQEQNDLSSCGLISALKTSKQEDYAIYLVPALDDYSDITNFKAFSEEQREYRFVREYTFNIINDNKSKREIFIIFDEDNQTASYNIIESKVELKRRIKAEDDEETFASSFSASDTTVKLTKVDNEYAQEIAETRMSHLKPVVIVDEDAMIEDEPTNDNSNARVHSPINEEESDEEDEDVDIFGDE